MTNIISTESDKYITCAIMLDYQAWINALQVSLNEENGYYKDTEKQDGHDA